MSLGLLAVTMVWLAIQAQEPITVAWVNVQSGLAGSQFRFGILVALWLSVVLALLLPASVFQRWGSKALRGFACFSLLSYVLDVCFRNRNVDEIMHLIVAREISQGQLAYRDFFHIYQPFLSWLWSPVMSWMDGDLRVLFLAKGLMLLVLVALLGLVYRLCRDLGASFAYALGAMVCVDPFVYSVTEFRPDPFASLFSLVALWALTKERHALAGLSLGVAFAFHQKAALWGLVLLICWLFTRPSFKAIGVFVGTTTATSLLTPLWALGKGIFPEYFRGAFDYTFRYAGTQTASSAKDSYSLLLGGQILNQAFPCVFALGIGIWYLLKQQRRATSLIAVFGPAVLLMVMAMKFLYPQYVLVFVPALALVVAFGLSKLEEACPEGLASRTSIVVFLAISLAVVSRWSANPPVGDITAPHRAALERISPEQGYWGYGIPGLVRHPLFRSSPTYYVYVKDWASRYFSASGIVPYEHSPSIVRPGGPAPQLIVGSELSVRACLEDLKQRGFSYTSLEPGVWELESKRNVKG